MDPWKEKWIETIDKLKEIKQNVKNGRYDISSL